MSVPVSIDVGWLKEKADSESLGAYSAGTGAVIAALVDSTNVNQDSAGAKVVCWLAVSRGDPSEALCILISFPVRDDVAIIVSVSSASKTGIATLASAEVV